jgi:CHAT domain-containing protein/tetratricopeptide (TPR) repeat protein
MGEVGNAVFEVARLALQLGQYDEARTALDEAEKIARREFGPRHINYASVLQMQAKLEREQGQPREALPLLQQAIDILRSTPECPDVFLAGMLSNFGFAYQAVGLYREAEKHFQQARELVKNNSTPQGRECYTATLANLAELFNEIGQDDRAEPLLVEALQIDRKIYHPDHPALATSIQNLGVYQIRHGHADEGIKLFQEALEIVEKSLGRHSAQYAALLWTMATALRNARRYQEAEVYSVFALETLRKSRPENSREIAGMLADMALVYACCGKFDQAEGALRKAVGIFNQTLPHDHKEAIEARFSLFAVLAAQNRKEDAFGVLKEAIAAESNVMDTILRLGSEKDRLAYLSSLQWHVEAALSFVVQNGIRNRAFVEWAFELILRRKGLAAEALSTQRDVVLAGASKELKSKLERLNWLKMEIARQTLGPGGAGEQNPLPALQSERADLEREMADSIPEIGLKVKLQDLNWKKLKGPERYAVFVLRSDETPSLELLDLGEAAPVDKAIADFRACLTGDDTRGANGEATRFSIAGALAALIPSRRRRREKQLSTFGQTLTKAVLDPIRPLLEGRKTVVVVPDGELLWLPFECLPEKEGYWLDQYDIIYLGTSRELVVPRAQSFSSSARAENPVVIADPDYDLHGDAKSPASGERQTRALREVGWRFAPLEGTRDEGEAIGKALGVRPLMRAAARVSTVKKLRSPRILHIATHGFFFDSRQAGPAAEASAPWAIGRLAAQENPMLRSGLALAGANSFLNQKPLPADAESGILTAEDVTGLDLHQTELVVLSACDSGLGEVHSGEGLFGFRRAFGLAGTRMLIVSLWKVADTETKELMQILYQKLLEGKAVPTALYDAKVEMRERHEDPFYWAAFICIGREPVRGKEA